MKKVFLTIVVSLIATVAFAQNYQDVIYLKNGSIIRGTIIEQVPNESLKIETADGNLFVYKIDEVEKMTKERSATSQTQTLSAPQKQNFVQPKEALNYDYVGGRKMYISFGGGGDIVGDVAFAVGKFELGYYINPHNLLSVEFGGGSHTGEEIGWFHWNDNKGKLHTDGIVNYDYNTFTFFASWSYIKDLSDRFQWRIGPSLGVLNISGGFTFDPSGLKGEPGKQSLSKSAFAFGANTGITWNFSTKKRWFLDLGWKLYGNTGINFEERKLILEGYTIPIDKKDFSNIGNQINLSVGWRFSKAK